MKTTLMTFAALFAAVSCYADAALVPMVRKYDRQDGLSEVPISAAKITFDQTLHAEGYRLTVTKDAIEIVAADAAGAFYAKQTLAQLTETSNFTEFRACCSIEDWPEYSWRGLHWDDCRHFFGKEAVKRELDQMAKHKFNRFHWHLTEDQGWRLDIPGYPELVKYGAVRPSSPRMHQQPEWITHRPTEFDGVQYGPFYYTEADIREIVAYAQERFITIVPEIELPGHFRAVLAAYPEYGCDVEKLKAERHPWTHWGIAKEVMCIGNDEAIKFLEAVLDYVCKLFPGDVVHIGGDECPQVAWKTCPKCQERIRKEGLGDEKGLQPWITKHFVKFLEARGKRALGWDEYLLGDVPASAMGMNWREGNYDGAGHDLVSGVAAAVKGHDIVMTPTSYCYLDYRQGLTDDPYDYIGGMITLARCHSFNPRRGVPEAAKAHIIGGQGNNWSEYTYNEFDLNWKIWPRACALAEVFWLGEAKPQYGDFLNRMRRHRPVLIRDGVNCAPLE